MSAPQSQTLLIRDPSTQNAALIARTLGEAGVPSALWGVSAAVHYGGGLCPLDIELVINDSDQENAYIILTSRGFLPSIPEDATEEPPADYAAWQTRAPSYTYRDRRKVRICTPIYDSPPIGDPIDDAMRPYVILYSAESVGLPKVPTVVDLEASTSVTRPPYVRLEVLDLPASSTEHVGFQPCLIPAFARLLESEIHVLLQHTKSHSPVWGQHMAQISELAHSRSAPREGGSLADVVGRRYRRFVTWFYSNLTGGADYEDMERVREAYLRDTT